VLKISERGRVRERVWENNIERGSGRIRERDGGNEQGGEYEIEDNRERERENNL